MGHWQDRRVYYRDFAFNARRVRMANGNIGDVPASSYAELLSGSMIDIFVGVSKRQWTLHRNLLCHHSDLLESELYGDGKKKLEKLELPDHDPAGFELLVKWLYQGKLDDVSDISDPNQKYEYAVSCHKLYLLCERFDMPQLKNVAIDQYRKGLNQAELVPDADEINDIYRQSPVASPFRLLMTKIAARQIMDPESHRDVETYRECFQNNPDFAVDLVNAIKMGTGGMLFEDPTDRGNECEYHDHEAGPNCHIKGKGRTKQALKASVPLRDPKSARSIPSVNSGLPLRPHRPPRLIPNPQPPARQARPQDGVSAGPLRRRLTSPASSTVETTTENAMASPPSPKEQRDKFRKVIPLHKPQASPGEEGMSRPVQEGHLRNLDGESPHLPDSSVGDIVDTVDKIGESSLPKVADQTSPRRGIWDWARAGTGRLGIIARVPHPDWRGSGGMTTKTATSAVNGVLGGGKTSESVHDDFSVPSTTSTQPENETLATQTAAAKMEGLGISNSTVDASLFPLEEFSQTKDSSDDLVAAASVTGTPSPKRVGGNHETTNGHDPPPTPSPPPRNTQSSTTPQRIPKYKIALASHLLTPSKTPVS